MNGICVAVEMDGGAVGKGSGSCATEMYVMGSALGKGECMGACLHMHAHINAHPSTSTSCGKGYVSEGGWMREVNEVPQHHGRLTWFRKEGDGGERRRVEREGQVC